MNSLDFMHLFELHKDFLADINECLSYPCVNGGTCVDQVDGYLCQCVPGYTGVRCQHGKNS